MLDSTVPSSMEWLAESLLLILKLRSKYCGKAESLVHDLLSIY